MTQEQAKRKAEIRAAINNAIAEANDKLRAEKMRYNADLNNAHQAHSKATADIESELNEKRNALKAELDLLHVDEEVDNANPAPVVSIVEYKGEQWVRVQAMGEDFIIAPHDLTDAKGEVMTDCTQPELMERLEELGLSTFNRKQGFIIATLIDEINAKLEVAGGDTFAGDWYASSELWRPVGSSADYSSNYTWCFNGSNGCFGSSNRYGSDFRSRPVLDFSTSQRQILNHS